MTMHCSFPVYLGCFYNVELIEDTSLIWLKGGGA